MRIFSGRFKRQVVVLIRESNYKSLSREAGSGISTFWERTDFMQLLSYDMCSHLLSPITESSSTIFVSAVHVHTENIEMRQERLKTMGDNKIVTVKVVAVAYQRWSLTIGL